eukprot:g4191.t1
MATTKARVMSTYSKGTIFVGSDHGGFDMKQQLVKYLSSKDNVQLVDMGCPDTTSVDYPDIATSVCEKIIATEEAKGILVCGSGIGISISANKVPGIRCALCHDHYTARFARLHNNAQVVALGGRTTGIEVAKEIVDTFLSTDFEGGRHERRVNKIMAIEK